MNKFKLMAVLTTVLLSGCKEQEDIETSVNNRWAQVVKGEYEQAYEYFSPAYRTMESLPAFSLRTETAKLKVNWIEGLFKSKICSDEDVCKVTVELEYKYMFPRRSMGEVQLKTEVIENWLKLDGRWYIVPSDEKSF